MRAQGLLATAMSAMFVLAGGAGAADSTEQCARPAGKEGILVNLETGEVVAAGDAALDLRRSRSASTVVWFYGANPFGFDYKVDATETALTDDAGAIFFSRLPVPKIDEATAEAETAAEQERQRSLAPSTQGAAQVDSCEALATKLRELKTLIASAEPTVGSVELQRQSIAALLAAAKGTTSCVRAVEAARKIGEVQLTPIADLDAVAGEIRRMEIAALVELERTRQATPPCSAWKELADLAARLSKDAQTARDAVGESKKMVVALGAEQARVAGVLANPDYFRFSRAYGPYDEATTVDIAVLRRASGEKDFPKEPLKRLPLAFGQKRFRLAAGLSIAFLPSQDYGPVQGFSLGEEGRPLLDAEGKPVVSTVVGLADDGDERLSYLLGLHVFLGNTRAVDWHGTVAVTDNALDEGFDVETLLGISISPRDGKFMLTVGAYRGRVEELRTGFYEGRALPTGVAEVPVRTDHDWGPALAFTVGM